MSPHDLPGNHTSLVDRTGRSSLPRALSSPGRSWLFVPGLDRAAQQRGLAAAPDVLVADLQELTSAADRAAACIRSVDLLAECRQAGAMGAVRINDLDQGGRHELEKVIEGGPQAVLTSQTESTAPIQELDALLTACECRLGLTPGYTAIVPVLASPLAIVRTYEVLTSSPRIKAGVLAGRSLAQALGMRNPDDVEALRQVRSRFALECAAAACLAVDSGHAYPSTEAFQDDLSWSRRQGLRAKQAISEDQLPILNQAFSPSTGDFT